MITMDREPDFETHSLRNFDSGFIYRYQEQARLLNILDGHTGKHLLAIQCKDFMHEHIDDYARLYDKTNQINALRISAYSTILLSDVISGDKLPALLHSNAGLARSILSLEHNRFEEFSAGVQSECLLKNFYIKFIQGTRFNQCDEYHGHYTAKLRLNSEQDLTVRSAYLYQLLIYLADGINLDLAARIYADGRKECASKLMDFASRLMVMSSILDTNFVPAKNLYVPAKQI